MENKIYVQYLGSDGERNGEYQSLIASQFKEFGTLSVGNFKINHADVQDKKIAEELERVYGDRTLEGILAQYKDKDGLSYGMLYYNDRANSYEWINYSIIKDVEYQKSFNLKDKHEPIDLESAIKLVEKEKNTHGTVNEHYVSYKLTSGAAMYTSGVKVTLENGKDAYLCSTHNAPYNKRQNILIPEDYVYKASLKQANIPTISLSEYKESIVPYDPVKSFMEHNKNRLDFLAKRQIYVDTTHVNADFLNNGINGHTLAANLLNSVNYITKIEEIMGAPLINTTNLNLQSDKEVFKTYRDMYNSVLENDMALKFYAQHKFSFSTNYEPEEDIFEIKVLDGNGKQISKLKLENASESVDLTVFLKDGDEDTLITQVIHIPFDKDYLREDAKLTIFEGNKQLSDISESRFKELFKCFTDCSFIIDDLDEDILPHTNYKRLDLFQDYTFTNLNDQISVMKMVNYMVKNQNLDLTPEKPEGNKNKKTPSIS